MVIKGNQPQWLTIFFGKKPAGGSIAIVPIYQLTNELHRQIIRTFQRIKVYSSFRYNVWD